MSEEKKKRVPKKLAREVYRALENIVESEWISEDRAIIEAYSKFTLDMPPTVALHQKDPRYTPACIVLPETTEQVQAIVGVCNRYKVPFIPFTNGQIMCNPAVPDTVVIHLKRMNKILDIDEENMKMTVQAFVDYGQVNAEAMKRGLWNGGEPLATAICKLSSQFAFAGLWQTDLKYGGLNRNVISVKIVLPTGEIVTTGSRAVAGVGDFWEYGPGPDLTGLFRGFRGVYGIVTEITIKLHPWVGGSYLPEDAERPCIAKYPEGNFDRPPAPKRHKLYHIEFPDFESQIEALYKIARSGIGIGLNTPHAFNAQYMARTQKQSEEWWKGDFFPRWFCYVVIAGISSDRQIEYEEKVLSQIVKETEGKFLSEEHKPEVLEALKPWNLEFVQNVVSFRWVRRGVNPAVGVFTMGPIELNLKTPEIWGDAHKRYGTVHMHGEYGWRSTPEIYVVNRGHWMYTECEDFPESSSLEKLMKGAMISAHAIVGQQAKNVGYMFGVEPVTSSMPECGPNAFLLWRKFKKVFDPKGLTPPGRIVFTKEELEKEKPGLLDKAREVWGLPPKEEVTKKLLEEYGPKV